MPRITAPTVAEHHARQREALVNAAKEILIEQGVASITPAAVGARAGLARSSVYQYFASTHALLAQIIEDAFSQVNQAIETATREKGTPSEWIDTYVTETLRLAADGIHRPATALMGAELPGPCRAQIAELHATQAAPLRGALREFGIAEPELTAQLISGVLHAAMNAIEHGAPAATTIERTIDLIRNGLSLPPTGTSATTGEPGSANT